MDGLPAKEWLLINYTKLYMLMVGEQIVKPTDQDPENLNGVDPSNLEGLGNINLGGHLKDLKPREDIKPRKKKLNYIVAPNGATEKDYKNKPFIPYAQILVDITTSKHKIKVTPKKIKAWANSIRLLVHADGISKERVENALEWYREHHDDEYVPVIESGQTLREKFTRLEDALKRTKKQPKRKTGYKKGKIKYKNAIKI